jgi:SNF2 family DNA or RNA helicase
MTETSNPSDSHGTAAKDKRKSKADSNNRGGKSVKKAKTDTNGRTSKEKANAREETTVARTNAIREFEKIPAKYSKMAEELDVAPPYKGENSMMPRKLRLYQVTARDRMLHVERLAEKKMQDREAENLQRGILLADDMGLGKRTTVLSLLEVNRARKGAPHTTVIAVPASSLTVWESEIKKALYVGRWRILPAHRSLTGGLDFRSYRLEDILKYDIVLVSHGALASEAKYLCQKDSVGGDGKKKPPPRS